MRGDTQPKARHQSSGSNSRFYGGDLSFTEYVSFTRDMLGRAHSKLGTTDLKKVVEGNAPFELKPSFPGSEGKQKIYRRGILLTHGLTDSPYFMRHLAVFFQQSGFRVMAILLPGHGTQPGDLLDVRWQDWADAVAYGTDRLAEEADEVYLAGFSAGATLSIYQSLRDDRVRGLFLFSPALEISSRAAWANLHKLYSWLIPSAKWLDIKPDLDIYKYESFPKNAAAQMYALTRVVGDRLQNRGVDIPIFAAASADDATVDVSATLRFIERARHPCSKLVIYATDATRLSANIPPEKLERVNSAIHEKKILSFSHTSIVLHPEDAHYGVAGDYSNRLHYYPRDMEKYNAFDSHSTEVFQGEVTEGNLKAGILHRLMYNPKFDALGASMRRFIDVLS